MDSLKHKCFLDELLFWTIKYEFPQKMVTFLLNMLPDQDYKVGYIFNKRLKISFFFYPPYFLIVNIEVCFTSVLWNRPGINELLFR